LLLRKNSPGPSVDQVSKFYWRIESFLKPNSSWVNRKSTDNLESKKASSGD
jgi:hypothetical protein